MSRIWPIGSAPVIVVVVREGAHVAASVAEKSGPGRLRRVAAEFTSADRRAIAGMTIAVVALHVIGFGALFAVIAPHHYDLGSQGVFGVGLGITAYTLGMRHAFDADHIAAIDNTTRKLLTDGKRPLTVGFWFSLGHSSVVFGMCLLLTLGVRALNRGVQQDDSRLHTVTGLIGTSVSGVFLWIIGLLNLVALIGIIRVWRRARGGHIDEQALEEHLSHRGFFNRFLGRMTRAVTRPAQMYPIGFVFGLGFDTATEISLLVIAGGAAATLPWYAVLTLPVLFTAGMSLLDAADGVFMGKAYKWAFAQPLRRLYYNATVTGISVFVALVIGTIELCSIVAERMKLSGGPVAAIGSVDLDSVGFIVVGVFIATWLLAVLAWFAFGLHKRESVAA